MKKYEALYLVSPAITDSEVQAIADKFKAIVEKEGGVVESAGRWEKRKLAYEIKGLKEANYILMNFEADAKVPAELRRQIRNSEEVIRHLVLSKED